MKPLCLQPDPEDQWHSNHQYRPLESYSVAAGKIAYVLVWVWKCYVLHVYCIVLYKLWEKL